MEEPILDDYEKELVSFCAQRFLTGKEDVPLKEVPGYSADTHEKTLAAKANAEHRHTPPA